MTQQLCVASRLSVLLNQEKTTKSRNFHSTNFVMDEEIKVSIAIPFPSKRAAQIAYDVLRIDAEPKRNHVNKTLDLEENILKVEFTCDIAKSLRVGITNFFETLILCTETQAQFGPGSEEYNHY